MATIVLKPVGVETPVRIVTQQSASGREHAFTASIDNQTFEFRVESIGAGTGFLHLNGRVVHYHVAIADGVVHVWASGTTSRFEIIERAARRAKGESAAMRRSDLTAPMPGTVLKVLVARGERFAAHAPLVVMESMKMEMTLSAPHAGRVKEIACQTGQMVAMGAVLMRFDEADDGDAA
ncbi:MAG TPA: biotin/lipoyl-containing protein [Phycisphaerae bacterium]|nr:biotin/lipoyl-containing protein [Phycisphaerae bacterium]